MKIFITCTEQYKSIRREWHGKQNNHRRNCGVKCEAETEGKVVQRFAPPGNPSHIQTPNLDTIADAKKCLLTGV